MSPRITAALVLAITLSAMAIISALGLLPVTLATIFTVVSSLLASVPTLAVSTHASFAMPDFLKIRIVTANKLVSRLRQRGRSDRVCQDTCRCRYRTTDQGSKPYGASQE